MELNEIKKALYREKPKALFSKIYKGVAYYFTTIGEDMEIINFEIPIDDMVEAEFYTAMDAKLLNRWIVL